MSIYHITGVVILTVLHITDVSCQYRQGDIRLVNGSVPNEGRVEIYVDGEWGTVCDDDWGNNDAKVVCRQLGYRTNGAIGLSSAAFGEGVGKIALDNVACGSHEISLLYCPNNGLFSHNCDHSDDAGVWCNGSERLINITANVITTTLTTSVNTVSISWETENTTHITKVTSLPIPSTSTANTVGGVLGFVIIVLLILLGLLGAAVVYVLVLLRRKRYSTETKQNGKLDPGSQFVDTNLAVPKSMIYVTTPSRLTSNGTTTQTVSHSGATGEKRAQEYGTLEVEYESIDPKRSRQPAERGKVNMRERYEFAEIHNDSETDMATYEVPTNLYVEEDENYSHLKHSEY